MKTNNVYRKIFVTFLIMGFLTVFYGTSFYVSAESSAPATQNYIEYVNVIGVMNNVLIKINAEKITLSGIVAARDRTVISLRANTEDKRENARSYIFGAAEGAVSSVLTSIFNAYEDEMDGLQLLAALDGINAAIEVQLGVINGIFTRVASEEDGTIDGYNAMYQKHVDSYNALTPHEKTTADGVAATPGYPGAGILPERTPPTVDTFGVHACGSPHGNCYGYYKDAKYHWRSCMHKHGVSGETNVEYWTCQPGGCLCPRRSEHWIACRGATCNVLFPPPTFSYIQYGTYPYSYAEYYDHEIVCKVPVHSWWNPMRRVIRHGFPAKVGVHIEPPAVFFLRRRLLRVMLHIM